jgi:hypothetical protein
MNTDYPITELGDAAGKLAKTRTVKLLSYDGDKYCYVEVEGIRKEIKAGYIYSDFDQTPISQALLDLHTVCPGWSESSSGMLCSGHTRGGIIDKTIKTRLWFVVFNDDDRPVANGLATRDQAVQAFISNSGLHS